MAGFHLDEGSDFSVCVLARRPARYCTLHWEVNCTGASNGPAVWPAESRGRNPTPRLATPGHAAISELNCTNSREWKIVKNDNFCKVRLHTFKKKILSLKGNGCPTAQKTQKQLADTNIKIGTFERIFQSNGQDFV